MYKLGKVERPKRHVFGFMFGALVIVVVVVATLIILDTRNSSKVTSSSVDKTISTNYVPTTQKVDEKLFTMEVPKEFKVVKRTTNPYNAITWQSTGAASSSARYLTIYIDTIPTNMAINRLTPVNSAGDQISASDTSDNCSTFVGTQKITPEVASKSAPTPGKWQGINFICDLPNYVREVAGTGSTEGINTVSVTGQTTGKHKYFFMYTDHTAQPDFSKFTTILNSFQAK